MISIVIPTYNRERLISKAVESILGQTYKDWELFVVDDGSKDGTAEVMKAYCEKDPRVHYLYKENGGQGTARNVGIRSAKGEYLAFLDSDDEWLPEKLEKQIAVMERYKEYDFCYTANVVFDEKKGKRKIERLHPVADLSPSKLAGISMGALSSLLYRKSSFDKIGLFDENTYLRYTMEDNDWTVRGHFLKGYYLDEPLVTYNLHIGNISKENMSKKLGMQISALEYVLEKNFSIISQDKKAVIFRQQQLGHLCMLAGRTGDARKYFSESLKRGGGTRSMFLLLLSCFPYGFYRFLNKCRPKK